MEKADTVLVSGGSSVGAADWTLATFRSFEGAELLVHGVSISPGKPLILVGVGRKSLWGLPGHAASAMISFHLFLKPLISGRLLGATEKGLWVKARLARNLASTRGREDWVRVGLEEKEGEYLAQPVLGPSGLISTLVRADGLVRIDYRVEGLEAGEQVEVHLL
jgi:molybdopterin molybdotransferase